MWSGSGLLALHALHALQLNLAFAEADKGLRVRSSELVDMHESKTCMSSECFVSGCKFTGTEVSFECGAESSPNFQPPQPFNYRIDCRGATGNFQNLTVYARDCGRLSYKKYKNGQSSGHLLPTTPWQPLIFDHIVTLDKDDVMDLQCVLLPFDVPFRHYQRRSTRGNLWSVFIRSVRDGLIQSLNTHPFINFKLSSPTSMLPSCATAVEKTYDWTMELWESINYTHFLRLKSRTLGILELPKLDQLDLETQQGEIFQVDKDFLKVRVLEATSDLPFHKPSESLVELDETFYSSSMGPNGSFAVDLKLEVNPEELPPEAADVNVTLQVKFPQKKVPVVFSVMIPMNSTGVAAEGKSSTVIWFMVFLILIFLVAAISYVYREEVAQSFYFPRVPSRQRSSIELRTAQQGS